MLELVCETGAGAPRAVVTKDGLLLREEHINSCIVLAQSLSITSYTLREPTNNQLMFH